MLIAGITRLGKLAATTLGKILASVVFIVSCFSPYTLLILWIIYTVIVVLSFSISVSTPHYAIWNMLSKKNEDGRVSRKALKALYVVEMVLLVAVTIIYANDVWSLIGGILSLQPHGFMKELADKLESIWYPSSSFDPGTLATIWWCVMKIQLMSIIVGQYIGIIAIPCDTALRKNKEKQIWGKRFT